MQLLLIATAGALGAFTTFSTFSYEAVMLAQDGDWQRAGAYVAASVGLGLLDVVAGLGTAVLTLAVR